MTKAEHIAQLQRVLAERDHTITILQKLIDDHSYGLAKVQEHRAQVVAQIEQLNAE